MVSYVIPCYLLVWDPPPHTAPAHRYRRRDIWQILTHSDLPVSFAMRSTTRRRPDDRATLTSLLCRGVSHVCGTLGSMKHDSTTPIRTSTDVRPFLGRQWWAFEFPDPPSPFSYSNQRVIHLRLEVLLVMAVPPSSLLFIVVHMPHCGMLLWSSHQLVV